MSDLTAIEKGKLDRALGIIEAIELETTGKSEAKPEEADEIPF